MTFNASFSGWAETTDGLNKANPEAEEKASEIFLAAVAEMSKIPGIHITGSAYFHNTGSVSLPVKHEGSGN